MRVAYRNTTHGKNILAQGKLRYAKANRDKKKSNTAIGNAKRDGRLAPWPACALPECNSKPEAHHPNYDAPFDVVWLCHKHHMQTHKEYNALMRSHKNQQLSDTTNL